MRLFIPENLTYNLNNRCVWDIYDREREVDSQNDVEKSWQRTGESIETTDPKEPNTQDRIMLTASLGLAASTAILQVWIKDIDVTMKINNKGLKNVLREEPSGECIELLDGIYTVVSNTSEYGLNRPGWIFLVRNV